MLDANVSGSLTTNVSPSSDSPPKKAPPPPSYAEHTRLCFTQARRRSKNERQQQKYGEVDFNSYQVAVVGSLVLIM